MGIPIFFTMAMGIPCAAKQSTVSLQLDMMEASLYAETVPLQLTMEPPLTTVLDTLKSDVPLTAATGPRAGSDVKAVRLSENLRGSITSELNALRMNNTETRSFPQRDVDSARPSTQRGFGRNKLRALATVIWLLGVSQDGILGGVQSSPSALEPHVSQITPYFQQQTVKSSLPMLGQ